MIKSLAYNNRIPVPFQRSAYGALIFGEGYLIDHFPVADKGVMTDQHQSLKFKIIRYREFEIENPL